LDCVSGVAGVGRRACRSGRVAGSRARWAVCRINVCVGAGARLGAFVQTVRCPGYLSRPSRRTLAPRERVPSEGCPTLANICSGLHHSHDCATGSRSPRTSSAIHPTGRRRVHLNLMAPCTRTRTGARSAGSANDGPARSPRVPHTASPPSVTNASAAGRTRRCDSGPAARSRRPGGPAVK
jgi:hypothetical protein